MKVEIMNEPRKRGAKKTFRVTFPSGKVICYNGAASVMIDVLEEIGSHRFSEITLEMSYYPLLSREENPKFKGFIKPVCDSWFINTQSNTEIKFMQLKAISNLLDLNPGIEMSSDFETADNPYKASRPRTIKKLVVKLSDGELIGKMKSTETYLEAVRRLGVENIYSKRIAWRGAPLITSRKIYDNQVQVEKDRWITVPGLSKDMEKVLKIVGIFLRVDIEVNLI